MRTGEVALLLLGLLKLQLSGVVVCKTNIQNVLECSFSSHYFDFEMMPLKENEGIQSESLKKTTMF